MISTCALVVALVLGLIGWRSAIRATRQLNQWRRRAMTAESQLSFVIDGGSYMDFVTGESHNPARGL